MTDNSALVSVGFGNIVSGARIIAVVSPDSAPVKRLIQDARERRLLIDASCGRKTRSVLIMDSEHVILSGLQSETLAHRLCADYHDEEKAEEV
jgi:regulator of extracellular matrix RemA (YlzA/DUF370 family)